MAYMIKTEPTLPYVNSQDPWANGQQFEEVTTFRDNKVPINGLTFSDDGHYMVTSDDDGFLYVYDCHTGTKERAIHCVKCGCSDVKYLHAANNILFAASKTYTSIRHFSLYDQKFIRFFHGHTARVTRLAISPVDDLFLSASEDRTVRFWDARQQDCLGMIQTMDNVPNIAIDPDCLVVAVAVVDKFIKLYDKRYYENGPFSTFDYSMFGDREWVDMSFSNDGKFILISTPGDHIRLVDAFEGQLVHTLSGHTNENNAPLRAAFSLCSNYIACGGTDGKITFWSRETGSIISRLSTDHTDGIRQIEFNPVWKQMGSTARETKLWQTKINA
ncbi:hypothetical protein M3Y94_00985400 [Aphelenchoides besseyi]|nr:hypothetical protein M3Y94_00985400 [Aphelenchoides besseyi]KAI6221097.1 WD repeat-containing protein 82-like isoform X1 [Aphelenchoides besseyi]